MGNLSFMMGIVRAERCTSMGCRRDSSKTMILVNFSTFQNFQTFKPQFYILSFTLTGFEFIESFQLFSASHHTNNPHRYIVSVIVTITYFLGRTR